MGLDMYAFAVPPAHITKDTPTDLEFDGKPVELFYWRKHHDLHGWMQQLYQSKGGESTSFNCNTVRLLPEDLDELERAVNEDGAVLPVTTGFFFGNFPPDDETRAQDLEFIAKARAAIADGMVVFYDSWW